MNSLSDKPESPLPWTLQDNIIRDASGESILGIDGGLDIGFPCEQDADFIYRAVKKYTEK